MGANAGHTGGSLSCIDILNVLYNHVLNVSPANFSSPDRDRYIQSKGIRWRLCTWCFQIRVSFLSRTWKRCAGTNQIYRPPHQKVNGVEIEHRRTFMVCRWRVGNALAAKMDDRDFRVFTLLGDGELPEGSNWEAFLTGSHLSWITLRHS